jgi:putative ABC transport system permease protein
MARTYGINTSLNKIIGLGFANGLSALSGFLMVQIQGFADINMGIGIVIIGLASVMIADKIKPNQIRFSVSSELLFLIVGTLVYRLIISLSLLSGIPSEYIKLLTAILVLSVLFIPSGKSKKV